MQECATAARTLPVVVGEGNVGAALLEVVGLHHAVGLVRDLEVLHERLLHVPVELQQLTQPLRQALCCVLSVVCVCGGAVVRWCVSSDVCGLGKGPGWGPRGGHVRG